MAARASGVAVAAGAGLCLGLGFGAAGMEREEEEKTGAAGEWRSTEVRSEMRDGKSTSAWDWDRVMARWGLELDDGGISSARG
uniref:Uncharacterized protein n=1 Tax=Arundo donax TaxID=35708 RepID=A0A0A9D3A5_ARUDO